MQRSQHGSQRASQFASQQATQRGSQQASQVQRASQRAATPIQRSELLRAVGTRIVAYRPWIGPVLCRCTWLGGVAHPVNSKRTWFRHQERSARIAKAAGTLSQLEQQIIGGTQDTIDLQFDELNSGLLFSDEDLERDEITVSERDRMLLEQMSQDIETDIRSQRERERAAFGQMTQGFIDEIENNDDDNANNENGPNRLPKLVQRLEGLDDPSFWRSVKGFNYLNYDNGKIFNSTLHYIDLSLTFCTQNFGPLAIYYRFFYMTSKVDIMSQEKLIMFTHKSFVHFAMNNHMRFQKPLSGWNTLRVFATLAMDAV